MELGLMELEMVTDAQVRLLRKLMKEEKRLIARVASPRVSAKVPRRRRARASSRGLPVALAISIIRAAVRWTRKGSARVGIKKPSTSAASAPDSPRRASSSSVTSASWGASARTSARGRATLPVARVADRANPQTA